MNKSFLKITIILSSLIALPGVLLAEFPIAINNQITDGVEEDDPKKKEDLKNQEENEDKS